AHALAPTPAERRAAVRATFMNPPVDAAARLALAGLETRWGSSGQGWNAVRDLPADSAAAAAWVAFGELAEMDGRWAQARTAFERALGWREGDALRMRAATAAYASGDAAGAIAVAPWPRAMPDSQRVAMDLLPLHVMALAQLRRPDEAARLVTAFDRHLAPGMRMMLAREVAMGWVRQGELARARAALAVDGAEADSSAAAGWLALFEGDAQTARAMLGRGDEQSAEIALALAVLARFRDASAPAVGRAFLTLAQGDTAAAAARFTDAADAAPGAASLLLLTAARFHLVVGDTARAAALWSDLVMKHAESAEAPEALLHHARVLLARGDRGAAMQQLERLVLAYPASALVPVARRELEAAREAAGQGR
nr:hypothetical protein [Gemmatimonadaceae bacterium]